MKVVLTILFICYLASCQSQPSGANEKQIQNVNSAATPQTGKVIDTTSGIIYFSLDNGTTWVNQSRGLPENTVLTDMAVASNLLGIATRQHGIFLFDIAANRWSGMAVNPPTTDNLDGLYFNGNKMFVGTENSGVFVSPDHGKTWTAHNEGLREFNHPKTYGC